MGSYVRCPPAWCTRRAAARTAALLLGDRAPVMPLVTSAPQRVSRARQDPMWRGARVEPALRVRQ